MGLFKPTSLIRFIPIAVVIGFTNGIAVIGLSQVKISQGCRGAPPCPQIFWHLGRTGAPYPQHEQGDWRWPGPTCWSSSSGSAAAPEHCRVQFTGKLSSCPAASVALVLATAAVYVLDLKVETIGSRFGGIPATLPSWQWPAFSWDSALVAGANSHAGTAGAIESLLCARVADSMTEDRHDPNQG